MIAPITPDQAKTGVDPVVLDTLITELNTELYDSGWDGVTPVSVAFSSGWSTAIFDSIDSWFTAAGWVLARDMAAGVIKFSVP